MSETYEQVPLDVIDDPYIPMRTVMDDEKLEELARSIRTQGLIQPITLRRSGDRFEVVAGHRRFTASKLAGLVLIPAIVRELDSAETDAMRMHENLYREDVNPVDEGRFIQKMIEEHGYDPEQLSAMTGKSKAYLISRYDLFSYPDYLLQAVEQERIGLGASKWLFKITDDAIRKEYTRFAITGGITEKRAQAWFQSWEIGALPREATAFVEPVMVENAEPMKLIQRCCLCQHEEDIMRMGMYYAHGDCAKAAAAMHDRV